jgi:hypothetical protein
MSSKLEVGQFLRTGECLVSGNGWFNAVMQPDGNFCIYRGKPQDRSHRNWFWGTQVAPGPGQYFAILQGDGHFCIYRGTGPGDARADTFVWGTGVAPGPGRHAAILQDDGNFCVYPNGSQGEFAIWCSGVTVPWQDRVRGVRVRGGGSNWTLIRLRWSGGGFLNGDLLRDNISNTFLWDPQRTARSSHPQSKLKLLPDDLQPGIDLWPAMDVSENVEANTLQQRDREAEVNVVFDPQSPHVAVYDIAHDNWPANATLIFQYKGVSTDWV